MIHSTLIFLVLILSRLCAGLGIKLPPLRPKDVQKGRSTCLKYESPVNELVVVRINSGNKIESQSLNLQIRNARTGDLYREKDNIVKNIRIAFTTTEAGIDTPEDLDKPAHTQFEVCFENIMIDSSWSKNGEEKEIILDVEIGDQARTSNYMYKSSKYKPVYDEMKQVESQWDLLYQELNFLVENEKNWRNINESSQSFYVIYQVIIIVILVVLGITQILYFNNYFKVKKLL